MSGKRSLIEKIMHDRLLQFGVLSFVVFLAYFAQETDAPERAISRVTSIDDVPSSLLKNLGGVDPLIVQLPATEDDVTRATVAQLSGRAVLVLDEAGIWHRMEPARDDAGNPADHSQTLAGIAKLMCMRNGEANPELGLPELSPERRRRYCEVIPSEVGSN